MIDIKVLKSLAEAAFPVSTELYGDRNFGTPYSYAQLDQNQDDFIAAAKPAAVLELIAEIERLQASKATLERLGYSDNGGQLWKPPLGKKPDFDLIDQLNAAALEDLRLRTELMEQFNQLKAENESLRKDAERYRWLRENASVILDRKTAYQAETGFIKFDTMPARSEMETAIDAAMSKDDSHD